MADPIPGRRATRGQEPENEPEPTTSEITEASKCDDYKYLRSKLERFELPGEKGEYRAEIDRWRALYPSTSVAACHLINCGVFASIQLRRIDRAEAALVRSKVRAAERAWDKEQEDEAETFKRMLGKEPAAAVRGLEGIAAGCRWLVGRWRRLEALWEQDGTWRGPDLHEAIQLQGVRAELACLRDRESAYLTWFSCLLAQPDAKESEIAALVAPGTMPMSLQGEDLVTPLPPRSRCREWLGGLIERELTRLRRREERLRVEHEEPARAAAGEQALVCDKKELGSTSSVCGGFMSGRLADAHTCLKKAAGQPAAAYRRSRGCAEIGGKS